MQRSSTGGSKPYLDLQTNFLTTTQFKVHKSLEAYNQFVCGWVKDVHSWKVGENWTSEFTLVLS